MFSAVSTSVTSSSGEVESFVAGSPSVGTTSVEDALGVEVVVVCLATFFLSAVENRPLAASPNVLLSKSSSVMDVFVVDAVISPVAGTSSFVLLFDFGLTVMFAGKPGTMSISNSNIGTF